MIGAALAGCGSSGHAQPVAGAPAAPASPAATAPTPAATVPAPAAAAANPPPAHPIPASFRVAPGAPSDAEVRRELAQMYRIQRRQKRAVQQYQQQLQQLATLNAAPATFANLLPWSQEHKLNQVSVASVFTDYGLGLACGGVLGRNEIGVAHKTAPCGTLIDFTYAGRVLRVPVIDRGPYIAGREWDLTGAAAAALGFPGLGQIQWSVAR